MPRGHANFPAVPVAVDKGEARVGGSPTACFVTSSGHNVFFEELVSALETAVEGEGVQTERAVDHFPPIRDGVVYVLVPHEYVPLTRPPAHPSEAQLARTVVISTEQPGTRWFEETLAIAARAGAVVDINTMGVAELDRRGVEARHLRLGYVPAWDEWQGRDGPRPIDVTFMGGATERRRSVLAGCGWALRGRRSALHLYEFLQPRSADDPAFFSGSRKWQLLLSSKILLNVHRDATPYLEWQRIIGAITNGAVVLSEHSNGFDPLVPGEHFFSVGPETLPYVLDHLLEDDDRLEDVRQSAYAFLRAELPLSQTIATLAEAIGDVARRKHKVPAPNRGTIPAPTRPARHRTEWERVLGRPTELDLVRRGLKQVLLGQRRVERRLRRLEQQATEDREWTFGPHAATDPRVSVVITLYNYADVVGEAIASVARAENVDVEAIVVEDSSTDDSLEVARLALEAHPWLPARLTAAGENRGLPTSRNRGIAQARGEYVFFLDADNAIYPHALERLAAALDDDKGAAMAYGLIEQFDTQGPTGLLSWHHWDPRRLAYGNYIDAMALVRRSVLDELGGFPTDERLYGWEDLALWCALAQAGMRGRLVPEIVARYRTSRHSMIGLTNIDTSEAWSLLIERYPFLTEAAA